MNNPVIYWVIGGLLILFFFYLIYQFTSTWRIWHIIFMFLVFAASIAMCAYISMTLRTHNAWRTVVRQQSEQIVDLKIDRDSMLYGDLLQVDQSDPSIRSLNAMLGRALIDRGRVWRECVPAQPAADDTVQVSTQAPGAAAGESAPNRMEQSMILYVFMELEAPEAEGLPLGAKVPAHYIGEFTAAAVTDTSVTLKPLLPLATVDKKMLRQPNFTWALYETMPVDGHRFFVADQEEQPKLQYDNADEYPVFGQMDETILKRTFEARRMAELNTPDGAMTAELQARYDQMIAPYLRDGKRSNDEDPPDNVWEKVTFEKKYEEDVDTAGDPLGAIQSSEDFFDRGRSEIALLRRGDTAKFKPGDWAVFPQDDANRLIAEEYAKPVESVFVRSLNDYESGFRNISSLLVQIAEDKREVERDTADVQKTNALVEAQLAYRQDERTKVTEDLQKFTVERDRINAYAAALETRWAEMRTEMSELYRVNHQLADELARLDQEITDAANRRTLEAIEEGAEGG